MHETLIDQNIEVLVAEDHSMYRQLLIKSLDDHGIRCAFEASNGEEICNFLKNTQRSWIVLLDLNMPLHDGSRTLNKIRIFHPNNKVIITSQFADYFTMRNYLERGASAFVPKTESFSKLVEAILTVNKGQLYIDNITNGLHQKVEHITFSEREIKIMKLIIQGKTNKEIAGLVFRSIKTVEVDRLFLYRKVGVHNLTEFIAMAYKNGWNYLDTNINKS